MAKARIGEHTARLQLEQENLAVQQQHERLQNSLINSMMDATVKTGFTPEAAVLQEVLNNLSYSTPVSKKFSNEDFSRSTPAIKVREILGGAKTDRAFAIRTNGALEDAKGCKIPVIMGALATLLPHRQYADHHHRELDHIKVREDDLKEFIQRYEQIKSGQMSEADLRSILEDREDLLEKEQPKLFEGVRERVVTAR